jgi:hypothetical protein
MLFALLVVEVAVVLPCGMFAILSSLLARNDTLRGGRPWISWMAGYGGAALGTAKSLSVMI